MAKDRDGMAVRKKIRAKWLNRHNLTRSGHTQKIQDGTNYTKVNVNLGYSPRRSRPNSHYVKGRSAKLQFMIDYDDGAPLR